MKINQHLDKVFDIITLYLPAALAVGFKLALDYKRKKFKLINAVVSMFIGVGASVITYPYIKENFSQSKIPIMIALVALCSEKIIEFLLQKIEKTEFLEKITDKYLK